MKIQLLKENLQQAVGLAARFSAQKTQLPVLSHILLRATKAGIFLAATDLELGLEFRVGGKVEEEGSVAVPAKLLLDVVNALPAGTVRMGLLDEVLGIEVGAYKAKLQVMGEGEFPRFWEDKKAGGLLNTFKLEDLGSAWELVGFSVSNDETRPVLTGCLWEGERGRLVGTDGFRLSMYKGKMLQLAGKEQLIIAGKFLEEGLRVMSEVGGSEVELYYEEERKQIQMIGGDVLVVGRVLAGEYPPYEAILPKEALVSAEFNKDELLGAVKAASVFARDSAHILKWQLNNDGLVVSANAANVGEQEVKVEYVRKEGGESQIAFNSRYLLDVLGHLKKDTIWFGMSEPLQPGWFKDPANPAYQHVIMPVRVREGE